MDRSSGATNTFASYTGGTLDQWFVIQVGQTGDTNQVAFYDGQMNIYPSSYAIEAQGSLTITTATGDQLEFESGGQLNMIAAAGSTMFWAADTIAIAQASTVQHSTIDNAVSATRFYPTTDNTGYIGLSTARWSNINGVNITGATPLCTY